MRMRKSEKERKKKNKEKVDEGKYDFNLNKPNFVPDKNSIISFYYKIRFWSHTS